MGVSLRNRRGRGRTGHEQNRGDQIETVAVQHGDPRRRQPSVPDKILVPDNDSSTHPTATHTPEHSSHTLWQNLTKRAQGQAFWTNQGLHVSVGGPGGIRDNPCQAGLDVHLDEQQGIPFVGTARNGGSILSSILDLFAWDDLTFTSGRGSR